MTSRLKQLSAQVRELEERVRAGGGAERAAKQHKQGKLTARQRVTRLCDEGARFLEIGLLVAYDQYDGEAPAAGVITGIGMVQVHDLGFGTTWIVWGIIGLIASTVIGGALTGATARKLAARVAAGTADRALIVATQRRMLWFAIVNMLVLLSVIWAMVAKPS